MRSRPHTLGRTSESHAAPTYAGPEGSQPLRGEALVSRAMWPNVDRGLFDPVNSREQRFKAAGRVPHNQVVPAHAAKNSGKLVDERHAQACGGDRTHLSEGGCASCAGDAPRGEHV